MSDICERLGERLSEARTFQESVLVDEGTLADAKAEIERLRGIVTEAHAKPYHYMTADGKTVTARELEAQRNAAWRALAAAYGYTTALVDRLAKPSEESESAMQKSADAWMEFWAETEAAVAFVVAEHASKEGK